jgi:fatty acid-binding protein DegV
VFLDTLHYLAAGGRLSKTRAFFGDLLHLKPIISPQEDGACKEGVVRNRAEQIEFATKRLRKAYAQADTVYVMLQFSDNMDWIQDAVVPRLKAECSAAEIVIHPLSLTAGTHMGPGTWAMAYLPFDKHATPVKMPVLHVMNSLKKNDV